MHLQIRLPVAVSFPAPLIMARAMKAMKAMKAAKIKAAPARATQDAINNK
jgi:hypothetical protein